MSYSYKSVISETLYGRIFLAEEEKTGKRIAVKISDRKLADRRVCRYGTKVEECIKNEIRILEFINHHRDHKYSYHVIKLLKHWTHGKYYYMAMEHCDTELFKYIKKCRGGLDVPTAFYLFRQIIHGVDFMHKINVFHLDISSENILVSKDGTIKFCDFGLAMIIKTTDKMLKDVKWRRGKIMYMPPEAINGESYDPRAKDIFSCAVTFLISLTSRHCFEVAHSADKRFKIIVSGGLEKLLKAWGFLHKVPPIAISLLDGMLSYYPTRWKMDKIVKIVDSDEWNAIASQSSLYKIEKENDHQN